MVTRLKPHVRVDRVLRDAALVDCRAIAARILEAVQYPTDGRGDA